MALEIWNQPTGYSLGAFNDQILLNIALPVINDSGVVYSVIAGTLPPGLVVNGHTVSGTVSIVKETTIYKFCIRAERNGEKADRTFFMTIQSTNPLTFITPPGRLHCGINHQLFAIDDTYVNFQIEVKSDILNDNITFSLASGNLPNGLSLSSDGLISGMLTKLSTETLDNGYEESHFDIRASNGIYTKTQSFSMIVVGPYYLTADNTMIFNGTSIFTADVTNIRPVQWKTEPYLGSFRYDNYLTVELEPYENSNVVYNIDQSQILPPGTEFLDGVISGYVPSQSTYNQAYEFEISASRSNLLSGESIVNTRQFSLDLIGEFDNKLEWVTPSNVGVVTEGVPVNLSIVAVSSLTKSVIIYEIIAGSLPSGVSMGSDGVMTGVYHSTPSDENTEIYSFTVRATNQYSGKISDTITHYGVFEKEFTLSTVQSLKLYSNIMVKPLLPTDQRERWNSFITDQQIFPDGVMYRSHDRNYGVQKQLEMLIFPGIESSTIETFVNAAELNNDKKRFQFDGVSSAVAVDQTTFIELYEVVYIHMVDPLEQAGSHLPLRIDNPYIGEYYPSSVSLWRERLITATDGDNVLLTNINFIPLWMRSIQPSNRTRIGFILAVPLCYCKVGHAAAIIRNIELSGFDLKSLDYTVDRYIVDDFINPQYVVFKN